MHKQKFIVVVNVMKFGPHFL